MYLRILSLVSELPRLAWATQDSKMYMKYFIQQALLKEELWLSDQFSGLSMGEGQRSDKHWNYLNFHKKVRNAVEEQLR